MFQIPPDKVTHHACISFRAQYWEILAQVSATRLFFFFFSWKRDLEALYLSPFYFSVSLISLLNRPCPFYLPWMEYMFLSSLNTQLNPPSKNPLNSSFSIMDWIPHHSATLVIPPSSSPGTFYCLYKSLFSVKTPMVLWY